MSMKKTSSPIVAWVPVVLWMMLIFFLSAQSATESAGLSTKITQVFLGFINQVVPVFGSGAMDYSYLNHVVRKLAHFSLYMVLGILSARALQKNGMTGWKPLMVAVLICVMYAVTDELHQVSYPAGVVKSVMCLLTAWEDLQEFSFFAPAMRK